MKKEEKENWEKLEELSTSYSKLFNIVITSQKELINNIIEWAENQKINSRDAETISYNKALDELISYLKYLLVQLTQFKIN